MPHQERRSIRVRLFYLVVIFGITLSLAFMGISTINELVSTTSNVRQTLVLESNRTHEKVGDYFAKHKDILLSLSANRSFHSFSMSGAARTELVSILRDAQEAFRLTLCYYGREDDGTILNYAAPEGFDSRARPWYRAAVRKGGLAITEPYADVGTGDLIMSLAMPCYDDERLAGVLAIDYSLREIGETLKTDNTVFRTEANLLAKSDGTVLLSSDGRYVGKHFPFEEGTDLSKPATLRFDGQSCIVRVLHNEETGLSVISLISPREIRDPALRSILIFLAVTAAFLCLLVLMMNRVIGFLVVKPINALTQDMKNVQSFDLDKDIPVDDRTVEIHQMVTALDNMKKGLRSFRRYVPGDLVYQLIRNNTEAALSAERRTLSVCFCDIADFTTISEAYDPDRLARHLGAYFEGMTRILQEHEATVDKFIGDAIMAFWGAPRDVPDHARLACHAILRCQEFIRDFTREKGRPPFRTRFGLNYGEAIVGNMGYEDRLSYTAIGDTVNVASRYEGINKVYGTCAVVTESVQELTREEFAFREIDTVVVKGRTRGMKVYELLGRMEDYTEDQKKSLALWEAALDAYHQRDWTSCLQLLDMYGRKADGRLSGPPSRDRAFVILRKRLTDFVQKAPPDDWTGAVYLRSK